MRCSWSSIRTWYTTTKPFIGNIGGGESSDTGSGDRWDWTLGIDQYQWLKHTLESSDASLRFIFAHHGTGGTDDYIRGGANGAPYTEWGGRNEDGTTYAFDVRRPGWHAPIHQLLVENHVTAFFHGHDHEFAYEERDGVVYQLVPMAADSGYGFGFQGYRESDPYTIRVLPNSGHLRVSVSGSIATVDYVRAYLPADGTNGQVAYTYTMSGTLGGPPNGGTSVNVSPGTVSRGEVVTTSWSGIAEPSATDWIALYAPGTPDTAYIDWIYTSCSKTAGEGSASGSCSFVLPSTLPSGTYEIRLFSNDRYSLLASSAPFSVTAASGPLMTASPATIAPGGSITVSWSGIAAPTATDWMALYASGAAHDAFVDWIYVSCSKTPVAGGAGGSCPFVIPADVAAGAYQTRLFANGQYVHLATGNAIAVTTSGGASVNVSPTTVAPGGSVIASWNGIAAPTTTDWMGLYAPGAADEAFIDWIYVSCSQTTGGATTDGACPFVMPVDVPPGTYEVRLFANAATGQYTPLAVSNAFTVTATDGP